MSVKPGRWRSTVVASVSAVYAGVVALIGFSPALAALWRFTRPDARHGVVSVTADNTLMMHFTMTSSHLPTWTGSVNLGTLILWMLGPPVLLWSAWLATGPRRVDPTPGPNDGDRTAAALRAADADFILQDNPREKQAAHLNDR